MSLTAALATASRALEVFSAAVQVSSSNIANANTPGYIREELTLATEDPYKRGGLIVGTGVKATAVRQAIDQFLESRIHLTNSETHASSARESIYAQLEGQLRELGDQDLSSRFSSFLAAINEVANQPEQGSLRNSILSEGELLVADITSLRTRVDELRTGQTVRIENLVDEANNLIDEIADLNLKITKQESNGLLASEAGGLRTQRYDALNRLSEIIPTRFIEQPNGNVDVYSGSEYVLFSGHLQHIETATIEDRGVDVEVVQFTQTHSRISQAGGEIRGVIEGRDEILGGFIDDLDQIASSLISAVNRVHSSGEGLEGYSTITSTNQVDDANAVLSDVDLPGSINHGSFELKVTNKRTGITQVETIRIDLDGIGGNDTSLEDLRAAIDSAANVSATITTTGELKLDADPDFELRFADDTSGVLAALGINTFFTGSDSATIGINSLVKENQNLLATGQGAGPSDNRNVLQLATALEQPLDQLGGRGIEEFYQNVVSGIAQGASAENAKATGLEQFRQSLLSQREQFSGVSLDEEAVRLIEFQQAYAASARVIRSVDELFDILVTL
ncbi:MAG: flagellar hook-associated protein FlgK [Planctomycetota bacterium]|nr:flagellar hook-associated protein FlgK [Planctomycetota bacterium]MDA0918167.1 flagellar hook-associated protein FlgK [Planctomycetota bacterium]MDA1159170.1 flagellar hook-associated protein FlgK [Planctomycetota bacterium]